MMLRKSERKSRGKGVKKDLKAKGTNLTFASLASGVVDKANRHQRWSLNMISIGSDCAGLLSEGTALDLLQIPHEHKFASEKNQAVRHLLYDTHGMKNMRYYRDCTKRDNDDAPNVDLYVFGFPCTPYSPAGLGAGLRDKRSGPLLHCLEYVKKRRPTLVIAENSHRFASSRPVVVSRIGFGVVMRNYDNAARCDCAARLLLYGAPALLHGAPIGTYCYGAPALARRA